MKILVALVLEEGDALPGAILLRFADGTSLSLSHDQGQAHVDPIKFGIGAKSVKPQPKATSDDQSN